MSELKADQVANLNPYNIGRNPSQKAAEGLLTDDPQAQEEARERPQPIRPYRIIVFGSVDSGATDLYADLDLYLQGRGINDSDIKRYLDINDFEEDFYEFDSNTKTIPTGVILMSELRNYAPSETGNSFPTYESPYLESVRELCNKEGVPLIEMAEKIKNDQQITKARQDIVERFNLPK